MNADRLRQNFFSKILGLFMLVRELVEDHLAAENINTHGGQVFSALLFHLITRFAHPVGQ
jgi:hypothetical protein